MRIGYPCINNSVVSSGAKGFRLRSYSPQRLKETISSNLDYLQRVLEFNRDKGILFFRIASGLIPFASHPVCGVNWRLIFKRRFEGLGRFIRSNNIRVSMHPDQFTILNSIGFEIFKKSKAELLYHCRVLDSMGLDCSAKVQIHVGGAYGEKEKSIFRFLKRYQILPKEIKKRLVIENDEKIYSLKDCLNISACSGMPVVFDVFHHSINNNGEKLKDALKPVFAVWGKEDGPPILDYSLQRAGARPGAHAESIDIALFKSFLKESRPYDFDLMLEIKDKEKSAQSAIIEASKEKRLLRS